MHSLPANDTSHYSEHFMSTIFSSPVNDLDHDSFPPTELIENVDTLNSSSDTNDRNENFDQLLPLELRAAATVVCAFVMTFGIAGNVLVPFVVCRTKELCNSTNLFLINLSIADLLVIIVCMPIVLIELHSQPEVWTLGEGMCKAVPFVEMVVAHGSILTILAISFERYYAICKPLKAGYKCTQMRALVIIIMVWLVALVATIPVLSIAELSQASYIDGSLVPVCLTNANTTWQKIYFLASMTAFFWAPLCVLLVVYSVITKRLVLDDDHITCNSEHAQVRARRQVVLMLAAVVTCFFICLLPFRIFTLWLIFTPEEQIKQLSMEAFYNILYFCRIMLYVNSMLNPCLYAVVSSKFRDAFVKVLCCKRRNRLLIRQSTFNTTSSSVVMSSLKNSLHRTVHANNTGGTINASVHNSTSPIVSYTSSKNSHNEAKHCDRSKNEENICLNTEKNHEKLYLKSKNDEKINLKSKNDEKINLNAENLQNHTVLCHSDNDVIKTLNSEESYV